MLPRTQIFLGRVNDGVFRLALASQLLSFWCLCSDDRYSRVLTSREEFISNTWSFRPKNKLFNNFLKEDSHNTCWRQGEEEVGGGNGSQIPISRGLQALSCKWSWFPLSFLVDVITWLTPPALQTVPLAPLWIIEGVRKSVSPFAKWSGVDSIIQCNWSDEIVKLPRPYNSSRLL